MGQWQVSRSLLDGKEVVHTRHAVTESFCKSSIGDSAISQRERESARGGRPPAGSIVHIVTFGGGKCRAGSEHMYALYVSPVHTMRYIEHLNVLHCVADRCAGTNNVTVTQIRLGALLSYIDH